MHIEYNVSIPMYDGVSLSAAIAQPRDDGPFPCVLTRNCYTKWLVPISERAQFWTGHGYAFVVQDVRGRGDSDGEFYPLINERADGLATLDWLAAQPWCNGEIVMIGGSYGGWTQLYLASGNHPALVAIAPAAAPPDPDRGFPQYGGLLSPAAAAWMATLDGRTVQPMDGVDVGGAFKVRPIVDFDRHIGRDLKSWRDWVQNPPGGEYWQRQSYQAALPASRVPMLHISGWYDDCLDGALQNFCAMTSRGIDRVARAAQRLIIGPWGHGGMGQRQLGDIDHGAAAEMDVVDVERAWFDGRRKGEKDESAPVRLFVMGRNDWMEEETWPLARTRYLPYYLHSGGAANSRNGDGSLSTIPSGDEPPDHFIHDPDNPVPYCTDFDWRQVGGPDDFSEIELREDILVFTGPVLDEPLLICGPLEVRLFAATSARDTDWTAKVLDVYPDGRAIRLNDGAVRARFRNGGPSEDFLTPGTIEEYRIDCCATCIELAAGHRLRLEIASSAFGKYDINMNGGGAIGHESVAVVAKQTVYHDRMRASHLLLPVVD